MDRRPVGVEQVAMRVVVGEAVQIPCMAAQHQGSDFPSRTCIADKRRCIASESQTRPHRPGHLP